jgi:hypothetical protein
VNTAEQRLGQWLDGLQLPLLDDPRRRLEELCLSQLRNFFLLLLASSPDNPPPTPSEALDRLGPELARHDLYRQTLALPLQGSPESVVTAIELGEPNGELYALQERLADGLSEEGRLLILQLGRLF